MRLRFLFAAFIAVMNAFTVMSNDTTTTDGGASISKPSDFSATTAKNHFLDIGVGIGYDYGGIIGTYVAFLPNPMLSTFFALGWFMDFLGWNTGVKVHLIPEDSKHIFRVNFKIMYGVNSIIEDWDSLGHSREWVYLGFTPGIGFGFRLGRKKDNGLDLNVNLPLHGSAFKNKFDEIQNRTGTSYQPKVVMVSVGLHHEF